MRERVGFEAARSRWRRLVLRLKTWKWEVGGGEEVVAKVRIERRGRGVRGGMVVGMESLVGSLEL